MLVSSRVIAGLALCVVAFSQVDAQQPPSDPTPGLEATAGDRPIKVVIWTDRSEYSLSDSLELSVSLKNIGDSTTYIDRRLLFGGYATGLLVLVYDAQGKLIPLGFYLDELCPPPKPGDKSILIRLDEGYFYGTSAGLPVEPYFKKPGIYSIRVLYKSHLPRELVAPELRDLPAVWDDSPHFISEPVRVKVVE